MELQRHWAVAIEISENASIHPFNISNPACFQFHFKFSFCALLLSPNMKGPRTNALTVILKWNFEFYLHIDWKRIQFICRQQRILLGLWVIKETRVNSFKHKNSIHRLSKHLNIKVVCRTQLCKFFPLQP